MKRNLIKGLCVFGFAITLAGCLSDPYEKNQQQIRDKLSNAKVENINSYSELGCVSKSSESKNSVYAKKNKKRSLFRNHSKESTSQWYLAGLVDGEIAGLNTENGYSFWDIPVRGYSDLGSFIGFTPDYNLYEQTGPVTYYLDYSNGYGFAQNHPEYLLSKKTGKIYKIREDNFDTNGNWAGLNFDCFIVGKNTLYTHYSTNNNSYWSYITEENEQLVIKKSSMLEFIGDNKIYNHKDDFYGYMEGTSVVYDSHGNILMKDTIYGYNQQELNPNLEGRLPYGYEPYTQTIYTYCNDSFYVLEGLEFKKYDNVIFGYAFDGNYWDSNSNYCYLIDDEGKYSVGKKSDDEIVAIKRQGAGDTDYYWGDSFGLNTIYKKTGADIGGYVCYDEVGSCVTIEQMWDISSNDGIYSFGDGYFLCGGCTYKKSDLYTIEIVKSLGLNDVQGQTIYRDEYVYYITKDYKLAKCNLIDDADMEIDTGGYKIKEISQDSLGNIIISGYDSSFQEFTGYLDENDKVAFTPTNMSNGEYDIIYMSPIN